MIYYSIFISFFHKLLLNNKFDLVQKGHTESGIEDFIPILILHGNSCNLFVLSFFVFQIKIDEHDGDSSVALLKMRIIMIKFYIFCGKVYYFRNE